MSPFESLKNSNLVIRWAVAAVFIWAGVDKFLHPDYWINAWYPMSLDPIIDTLRLTERDIMNILGIVETLIGVSMITGLFIKWFAAVGLVLTVAAVLVFGFNEVIIRSLGLVGCFIAILLWPSRRLI